MAAAAVPVVQGVFSALGAQSEMDAAEAAGRLQERQLAFNKKLADISAEDAIARGEEQVADFTREAQRMKGAQRAALAAQGINVDAGSAAAIQHETDKQIDTDVTRIRNNAWREAWGYKMEASQLQQQTELVRLEAQGKSAAAALGGAFSAGSSFAEAGASLFSAKGSGGGGLLGNSTGGSYKKFGNIA